MAKDDKIELEGIVTESLKGGKFKVKVQIPNPEEPGTFKDHFIIGILSGRLRQNHIRVLENDTVTINVSPYDLNNGIITWRNK